MSTHTEFGTNNVNVKNYCSELFVCAELCALCNGGRRPVKCIDKCITSNENVEEGTTYFKKCIHEGVVYSTRDYERCTRWDDSHVKLTDGKCGQIVRIMVREDQCEFLVNIYSTLPVTIGKNVMPNMWQVVRCEQFVTASISAVDCNPVYVEGILRKLICYQNTSVS